MKNIFLIWLVALYFSGCTSEIKEKINQAGDVAGQTAGEFIEGASKGVQKAFDAQINLPSELRSNGIEFGKSYVTNDTIGVDNLLVVYIIFNKNFEGKLTAKVFDDKSLEMGRASLNLKGKKDEANYFEFHFDKRTNIDSKNKITIE